jgi:HNH endonuclease/AP2 domain
MAIHKKLVGKLKVSPEDLDLLVNYSWCLGNGYVVSKIDDKIIRLHRLIAARMFLHFDIKDPIKQIDHKDTNKLNCRRSNLRLATHNENQRNKLIQTNNTSGYKGVSWRKDQLKWTAYIKLNGNKIHLGYFATAKEAAIAYNVAAINLFGEYANLNKVD